MFFSRPTGHKFVDRGDPTAFDFTLNDFIRDETYRDLDLSSVVPKGAVVVLLNIEIKASASNGWVCFRKKGNVNLFNLSSYVIIGDGHTRAYTVSVLCDTNSVIQYSVGDKVDTTFNVVIRGWFI